MCNSAFCHPKMCTDGEALSESNSSKKTFFLFSFLFFLPPAIRRMGEGNIFSLAGGGGVPHLRSRGVPHLRSEVDGGYPLWSGGGTPARSRCWGGGYPISGLRWGTPGTPPTLGWGTPETWDGVPPPRT